MSFRTLLNPFTRIAGGSALLLGCLIMLLTAAIAAPCGVNFVGSLNIHVARATPFGIILMLLVFGWLNASVFFYIAGRLLSPSKIRAIDIFGTLALARAPFLLAAPMGLLPGWEKLEPQVFEQPEQLPTAMLVSMIAATVVFLLVDIWVVIWSYNAFAVSANLRNKWLFPAVLVVSEIVAVVFSSGIVALSAVGTPVSETAIASIDRLEPPSPEETQRVELAKSVLKRIVRGEFDSIPDDFNETMKKALSPWEIRVGWLQCLALGGAFQSAEPPVRTDTVDGYRRVFIPIRFERNVSMVILLVFDADGKIAGLFLNFPTEKNSEAANELAAITNLETPASKGNGVDIPLKWVIGTALIVPILLILIISFGEKWRSRAVGPFDGQENVGSLYRETQNPFWVYLLAGVATLPLIPAACLLWMVGEETGFWGGFATILGSVILLFLLPIFCFRFRFEVDNRFVRVRMGMFCIPIFWLPFDSIASVETTKFNPIRDFGGYGIRSGKGTTAYFMTGNQGVLLTTPAGKKYLLGSDTPDRLAEVIRSRLPKTDEPIAE